MYVKLQSRIFFYLIHINIQQENSNFHPKRKQKKIEEITYHQQTCQLSHTTKKVHTTQHKKIHQIILGNQKTPNHIRKPENSPKL